MRVISTLCVVVTIVQSGSVMAQNLPSGRYSERYQGYQGRPLYPSQTGTVAPQAMAAPVYAAPAPTYTPPAPTYQPPAQTYNAPVIAPSPTYAPPAVSTNPEIPPAYPQPLSAAPAYSQDAPYTPQEPVYEAAPVAYNGQAFSPWYVGVRTEIKELEDIESSTAVSPTQTINSKVEFDNGYGIGVIGGYRFHPNFRAEAEISYSETETDSINFTETTSGVVTDAGTLDDNDTGFQALTTMANIYAEYPVAGAPQLVPYVGGGVGYMFQQNGEEESAFAYQLMGGLSYEFAQRQSAVGLGYRFQQAPDIVDEDELNYSAESHAIELTLRHHF